MGERLWSSSVLVELEKMAENFAHFATTKIQLGV